MNSRRQRKPLPPPGERPWLLLSEAAIQIGCSPATIHRLRRGEIDGVPRLPAVQVGKRKSIVLKESLELRLSEAPNSPGKQLFGTLTSTWPRRQATRSCSYEPDVT